MRVGGGRLPLVLASVASGLQHPTPPRSSAAVRCRRVRPGWCPSAIVVGVKPVHLHGHRLRLRQRAADALYIHLFGPSTRPFATPTRSAGSPTPSPAACSPWGRSGDCPLAARAAAARHPEEAPRAIVDQHIARRRAGVAGRSSPPSSASSSAPRPARRRPPSRCCPHAAPPPWVTR